MDNLLIESKRNFGLKNKKIIILSNYILGFY